MTDLLKRLEAATEGSRELDAEIWLDVVPGATRRQSGYRHKATGNWCKIDETRDASGTLITVPHYTTSLDAALTLVPEGFHAGLDPIFFEPGEPMKYDTILCRANWDRWNPVNSEWIERIEARALTPALALCIAALKARSDG